MPGMYIMIAGPYRSGSDDPQQWKRNHADLNRMAYKVFKKGHTPVIGVNVALPIIETMGDQFFDELMMPISMSMAKKCDAVLRIGGPSKGADQEVEYFEQNELPIYYDLNEIPEP